MKTYKGIITELPENGILVFGSNTQGRHGKGSALLARNKYGAKYGQASGLQGKSYAIITKDLTKTIHPSFPESEIILQIIFLYEYAELNPDKDFYVAYSGTGTNLNGYSPKEMANMFVEADVTYQMPDNIIFEEEFAKLITNEN